jgi:transposase
MSATTAYAGIDVSKLTLDLALCCDGRVTVRQYPNDAAGVQRLLRFVTAGGRTVRAVLEPTSRFHARLRDALAAHSRCEVMAVNPARAHYFLAAFGQRSKTDLIDARGLALLAEMLHGRFVPFVIPSATAQQLQLLGRQLLALVAQRVQCKNRLSSFDPAEPLHQLAIASLTETTALLKQQADKLVAAMLMLINADAQLGRWLANLVQIKGISYQSAAQLLSETAVLPWDMLAGQWTACAGLDPRARQSGQSDPPQHISRMGNHYLRQVLYMMALSTTQFDPNIKRYYQYLQRRGKSRKLALTIIMRKLLTAFWVMQHRDQPFIAKQSFRIPAK